MHHTLDAGALPRHLDIDLPHAAAQYEIGYLVPAPGPNDKQSYAWRLALYTLTHGYGGRLGNEAISRSAASSTISTAPTIRTVPMAGSRCPSASIRTSWAP